MVDPGRLDRQYRDQVYCQDNISFFLRQGYTEIDAFAYLNQIVAYGLAQAKEDQIVPANCEAQMQVRNLEPRDFTHGERGDDYSINECYRPLESWRIQVPNTRLQHDHLEGTGNYLPSHRLELDLDRRIINAVAIIYGMENLNEGTGRYPVSHIRFMASHIRIIDIYEIEDFYYTRGSLAMSPLLVKRFDIVDVDFKTCKPLPLDFSIKFRGFLFKRKQDVDQLGHVVKKSGDPFQT